MVRLTTLLAGVSREKPSGAAWGTSPQPYGIQVSIDFRSKSMKMSENHDFFMKICYFQRIIAQRLIGAWKCSDTKIISTPRALLIAIVEKDHTVSGRSVAAVKLGQSALENMENHEKS